MVHGYTMADAAIGKDTDRFAVGEPELH